MADTTITPNAVRVEQLDGGALWHVVLATPKANVIDAAKIRALHDVFARAAGERDLKAIVLEGAGAHFSFGASVEEHQRPSCGRMLASLHAMLDALLESHVACIAAVRGQCLGGALELVSLCHRVIASADARLGQPEIQLGVFAPVASICLVERVGRGVAEDLLLSGRSLSAEDARACGLVDQLADDPRSAAFDYVRRDLEPKSASSLRFAVRASRAGFADRLRVELARLERLYLDELMASADAEEGLRAFLEKRAPRWSNA